MKKILRLITAVVLTLFLISCEETITTPTFKITFDHGYEGIKDVISYEEGKVITKPDDLVRNHYDFKGWFTKDGELYTFTKNESKSFTLYAKWDLIEYTIEYRLTQGQTNYNPVVYTIESEAFNLEPLANIEYEGILFATFKGWYDQAEDGNEITIIGSGVYDDLILYAQWEQVEEIETVNITVNLSTGTSDSYTVAVNATLDQLEPPKVLGHNFISFYFDGEYLDEISGEYVFVNDITIYALFEKIDDGKEVSIKEFYLEEDNLVYIVEGYEILNLIINEERYRVLNSEQDIYINLEQYKEDLIDEKEVILEAIGFDGAIITDSLLIRYYERQDDIVFYTTDFDKLDDTKGGYASAIVEIDEMDWMFDDALLGLLANDKRVGDEGRAVRMRNEGFIEMQDKFTNFSSIEFLTASYGNHASATIHVWIKDSSNEYIEVHSVSTTPNLEKVKVTSEMLTSKGINLEEGLQLKISKSGGNTINIENVRVYTFENAFYRSRQNIDVNYQGYYEGIDGLKGEQLFLKLRQIVSADLLNVTYKDIKDVLEVADMDPNNENNVLTIYDRQSVIGKWDGKTYHREHVWPNSRLGIDRVKEHHVSVGSDPHNLRAIIPTVNSSRSNRYFKDSTTPTNHLIGTEAYFPGDADKGDVARILLFMVVRYETLSLTVTPAGNDTAINYTPAGASMGDLSILLDWHLDDPVDSFEARRNDVIYSYQNNRNPFIDHEELFEEIYNYLMDLDSIKQTISNYKYLTIEISKNSYIKDDEDEYTVLFSTQRENSLFV